MSNNIKIFFGVRRTMNIGIGYDRQYAIYYWTFCLSVLGKLLLYPNKGVKSLKENHFLDTILFYTIQTNLLFSDVSLNVVCRIPSISGKRLFPCMCCSIETNSLLMVHTENHLGKFWYLFNTLSLPCLFSKTLVKEIFQITTF